MLLVTFNAALATFASSTKIQPIIINPFDNCLGLNEDLRMAMRIMIIF